MNLPEELEGGKIKMPEGDYTIMKVGNRDKAEYLNQPEDFRKTGLFTTQRFR